MMMPAGRAPQVSFATAGVLRYPDATPTPPARPPEGTSPMKYGFNLLLWTTHVTAEHFPLCARRKGAGYDGVGIPGFEGDAAHLKSGRTALARNGLKSTGVPVGGPEQSPISPDAAVRAKAL